MSMLLTAGQPTTEYCKVPEYYVEKEHPELEGKLHGEVSSQHAISTLHRSSSLTSHSFLSGDQGLRCKQDAPPKKYARGRNDEPWLSPLSGKRRSTGLHIWAQHIPDGEGASPRACPSGVPSHPFWHLDRERSKCPCQRGKFDFNLS